MKKKIIEVKKSCSIKSGRVLASSLLVTVVLAIAIAKIIDELMWLKIIFLD